MVVGILLAAPVWAVEDLGVYVSLGFHSLQKNPKGPEFAIYSKGGTAVVYYIPGDTYWVDTLPFRILGAAFDALNNIYVFFRNSGDSLVWWYKQVRDSVWRVSTHAVPYLEEYYFDCNTTPRGAGALYLSWPPGYYGMWEFTIFSGNGDIVEDYGYTAVCEDLGYTEHLIETRPAGVGYFNGYTVHELWGENACNYWPPYDEERYYYYRGYGRLYDADWVVPIREGLYYQKNGTIYLDGPWGTYVLPVRGAVDILSNSGLWACVIGGSPIKVYFPWGVDTIPDVSSGSVSVYFADDSVLYVAYMSGHLHIAHKKIIPMNVEEQKPEDLAFKTLWRAGEDVRIPWRWGYELYDASGKLVRHGPGPEVGKLRRGVYLIKMGKRVNKLVVR